MELRVEQVAIPEKIAFNYEELKQELSDVVKMYETLVYTDDQIKNAKSDRADLNKLKKALNDERIRREKEYMQPFNAFKAQIDEIIKIIDKPVALIDTQIKEYEEQQKQQKRKKIEEYFSSSEHPDWLNVEKIWTDRWMNLSVSMKSIQEMIDFKITGIKNDLDVLSKLPEFAFEAMETYKTTLDLNQSIAEGRRLSEMQKRKAEQEKILAEQERIRREQEERLPFTVDRSGEKLENPTLAMQAQAKEEVVQSPKELPTYVAPPGRVSKKRYGDGRTSGNPLRFLGRSAECNYLSGIKESG